VRPGDLVRLDGERAEHVVLAVEGDRALLLHVFDGLSASWCDAPAYVRSVKDPERTFDERARFLEAVARSAVFSSGADEALRCADEAGRWRALARTVAALRRRSQVAGGEGRRTEGG
jgi:hypothetical protein